MRDQETDLQNTVKWLGIISFLLSITALLVLSYVIYEFPVELAIKHPYIYLGNIGANEPLPEAILLLSESGIMISADQFVEELSSFYSTIIVLLLAILSFISGVAFLVIRAASTREIKETIEESLDRSVPKEFEAFLLSTKFSDMLKARVEEVKDEFSSDLSLLVNSRDHIEALRQVAEHYEPESILQGLMTTERRLAALDNFEDQHAEEQTLVENSGEE